jgi:hypothetical protein
MSKISLNNKQSNSRYIKPKSPKSIDERYLKYRKAEDLVNDMDFKENKRYFVFIDGSFFFGDFIEAFVVKNNIHIKKMTISTLSLNQNNIDSLANLLKGNFIDELNLIVSDYFYTHEKHNLIKYIYKTLDIDNKFQLSSAGTHCKLCSFETHKGRKFVIHGSANLRSSANIEQIMFEENEDLYNFTDEVQTSIVETYKTINKSIRYNKLWDAIENSSKVVKLTKNKIKF